MDAPWTRRGRAVDAGVIKCPQVPRDGPRGVSSGGSHGASIAMDAPGASRGPEAASSGRKPRGVHCTDAPRGPVRVSGAPDTPRGVHCHGRAMDATRDRVPTSSIYQLYNKNFNDPRTIDFGKKCPASFDLGGRVVDQALCFRQGNTDWRQVPTRP